MKIKKLSIRALALWGVAMAATACNFEDQLMPERVTSNPGRIAIECEVDSTVSEEITRAGEAAEGEVPDGKVELPDFITNLLYKSNANGAPTTEIDKSKLALRIWGTYDDPSTKDGANKDNLEEKEYAKAWDPMTEYEQGVELQRGYYQARIENRPTMKDGKIAEAVNNPYFAYETTAADKFRVLALETTNVAAKLKLMNSCFKLQTTQALMDYYTELELVIHTAEGEFKFKPTKSAASTVAEGTTTTPVNTNEVIAWESDADELYFFNVSEPIRIDDGKSNGLVETPQSAFTTAFKLSGWAKKQNGVTVYFTKNGKADGEPAELKPVKDNKPVDLATGTMYTLRVGHKTAGGAGLTITYNDYGEAEVTIIELRPEETDDENAAGGDDNENQNPGQTPEQGQN